MHTKKNPGVGSAYETNAISSFPMPTNGRQFLVKNHLLLTRNKKSQFPIKWLRRGIRHRR